MKLRTHAVEAEILGTYRKASGEFLVSKGDIKRIKSLRPSQLPFCPCDFFIRHATFGASRVMDLRASFYTSIGTSVHTVLQTYMGLSGKFLANWKCRKCGLTRKVSMQHKCCDQQMLYDEIEISYKGIVGHIDAVFRDAKGRYWIIDYKTTSVFSATKKRKEPSVAYVEQVEAYALMLYIEHGIKVEGIVLMFIKRDNPREPVMWSQSLKDLDFKRIKQRMIRYKKMHREVLAVETLEQALELARHGRCNGPYCKTCKLSVGLKTQLKIAYSKAGDRLPLKELQ